MILFNPIFLKKKEQGNTRIDSITEEDSKFISRDILSDYVISLNIHVNHFHHQTHTWTKQAFI